MTTKAKKGYTGVPSTRLKTFKHWVQIFGIIIGTAVTVWSQLH